MKYGFLFSILVGLIGGSTASAVSIKFPKTPQTIQVKAKDLLVKEEKPFLCVLEGVPEDKWSFQNSVEINVTAVSLQDAAELAFTPYMVLGSDKNSEVVKIKVDGKGFFVRNIQCTLVTRSI